MEIRNTDFDGLLVIKPKIFGDQRGYFFESYNKKVFADAGIHHHFVQDNQSKSLYGVIRGLHYQIEPYAQTKLVRVISGTILDVVVDIRQGSPTFGKHFAIELSSENNLQLLVPKGFAHGFSVLSENAIVFYKTDYFYTPAAERGIIYNDKSLAIDWGIKPSDMLVSERDAKLPEFSQAENNFIHK
jgi:dTDP-4-dehydrorhamnose 3,5-epimerase